MKIHIQCHSVNEMVGFDSQYIFCAAKETLLGIEAVSEVRMSDLLIDSDTVKVRDLNRD
jgi:hypothetical protein